MQQSFPLCCIATFILYRKKLMEQEPRTFTGLRIRQFVYDQFSYPKFSLCPQVSGKVTQPILITGHPGGGMAYYAYKRRHAALKALSTTRKD
jgi:hypothetical protein